MTRQETPGKGKGNEMLRQDTDNSRTGKPDKDRGGACMGKAMTCEAKEGKGRRKERQGEDTSHTHTYKVVFVETSVCLHVVFEF